MARLSAIRRVRATILVRLREVPSGLAVANSGAGQGPIAQTPLAAKVALAFALAASTGVASIAAKMGLTSAMVGSI